MRDGWQESDEMLHKGRFGAMLNEIDAQYRCYYVPARWGNSQLRIQSPRRKWLERGHRVGWIRQPRQALAAIPLLPMYFGTLPIKNFRGWGISPRAWTCQTSMHLYAFIELADDPVTNLCLATRVFPWEKNATEPQAKSSQASGRDRGGHRPSRQSRIRGACDP